MLHQSPIATSLKMWKKSIVLLLFAFSVTLEKLNRNPQACPYPAPPPPKFSFTHSSLAPPLQNLLRGPCKLTQNSVSFSCQSKQLSRCCMNFLHELTCQILTNQSTKIGRRAWPTRDHGKVFPPVFLKSWPNFRVRGEFEIKILTVRGHSDKNTTHFIWIIGKNRLEPTIIWNY